MSQHSVVSPPGQVADDTIEARGERYRAVRTSSLGTSQLWGDSNGGDAGHSSQHVTQLNDLDALLEETDAAAAVAPTPQAAVSGHRHDSSLRGSAGPHGHEGMSKAGRGMKSSTSAWSLRQAGDTKAGAGEAPTPARGSPAAPSIGRNKRKGLNVSIADYDDDGAAKAAAKARAKAQLVSLGGSVPRSITKLTSAVQANRSKRKKRTVQKLRMSSEAASAFLSLREDTLFRNRVFGKRHQEGTTSTRTRHRCIILPRGRFHFAWELLFSVALFWVLWRIPFVLAFRPDTTRPLQAVDFAFTLFLMLDVLYNFRLAFESEGRLVVSGWRIAMHYVCTWFVLDVVASVPYLWIFDPDSMLGLLAMLRVVRFARLERAELVWRSLFELSERHGSQLRLSKLLIYVLTIGHIAACAWYYLARWEAAYNSWTVLTGEIDGTVASRYVASLYWAFMTLTTVGYGDINANTTLERGYAIVMLFGGAVIFAAIVGKMSQHASNMNARAVEQQKHLTTLDEFFKFYKLPHNLRRHTQAYYKFLSHMHPFRNDNALLSDMVPSLRREVLMHMNQELIESVPIFKFGTLGFQAAVVALIEPAFCLAEQYLIVYGEVHAEMYFLGQGALQTIDRHGYPLNTFEDGTFLGELMVLEHKPAAESVRAVKNSQLFMLSRKNLLGLLADYPTFESTLRRVGNLRDHGRTNRRAVGKETRAPPPLGKRSWHEVTSAPRFEKFYTSVLTRSRTLQAETFTPKPQDLSHVSIPPSLHGVVLFLTRNTHEMWAARRIRQGWTVGPKRDHSKQCHPHLVPWDALPITYRQERTRATRCLFKFLLRHGYTITVDGELEHHVEDWEFGSAPPSPPAAAAGAGAGAGASSSASSSTASSSSASLTPPEDGTFVPCPCPWGDETAVSPELMALVHQTAKEQHLMWAAERKAEGWVWSARTDEEAHVHSALLPWEFLTDEETEAEVESVMAALRLLLAIGYTLHFADAGAQEGGGGGMGGAGHSGAEPTTSAMPTSPHRLQHRQFSSLLSMAQSGALHAAMSQQHLLSHNHLQRTGSQRAGTGAASGTPRGAGATGFAHLHMARGISKRGIEHGDSGGRTRSPFWRVDSSRSVGSVGSGGGSAAAAAPAEGLASDGGLEQYSRGVNRRLDKLESLVNKVVAAQTQMLSRLKA